MLHGFQRLKALAAAGTAPGLYSVCSAHPFVLRAAVLQAKQDHSALLVEATSNQVNQFGGYTGMRPADFRDFVYRLADEQGLPRERILLGGDHLGPNPWQSLPAEEAMAHAITMVAEYSHAGFVKIHLDASMACHGDQLPLPDEIIAERAARLCRAAEEASGRQPRFYVIGTEVPIPGGATESLSELEVTQYDHAAQTLATHREIFAQASLEAVWPRIVALVVQPGVEFNHDSVVNYISSKTVALRKLLADAPGLVFEAHSTDYQPHAAFRELVRDGFAILKVGPALTFALREALFALERIEQELLPEPQWSRLADVVEHAMLAAPANWEKHYHGTDEQRRILRRYSYSDRMRYYWHIPSVAESTEKLLANLRSLTIPETLLSAMLPEQYQAIRNKGLSPAPEDLILHKIRLAIEPYAQAANAP